MPKKQAFIDKSGVKFVENFQKNQKIKKFPSRTEIRYLTAFMQKSQGDAYAQNNIGAMYYLGHGERQDYAKAAEWFEKACDNGNKKSCYFSFKSKIGY